MENKVLKLVPATEFTLKALTDAYNQTRMDYIVPMPMTVSRLEEYISAYDVDLAHSCAAIDEIEPGLIYGIGMLGVRQTQSWITRLGVLPYARRLGTGRMMMAWLIKESIKIGTEQLWLEVIAGNKPAHALFRKNGFVETRELIVSRRPPSIELNGANCLPATETRELTRAEMIAFLNNRRTRPNWLNQTDTFNNIEGLAGYFCRLEEGAEGWVIFEPSSIQLKRVIVEVISGDEPRVTHSILYWLHQRHAMFDAISENIATDDPRWLGYQAMGYFDSFHRVEMVKDLTLDQ